MDPSQDFAAFYRANVDVVISYCYRSTGDRELSADLTGEIFAAALRSRDRFHPNRGSARQWLLVIAAKKIADAQRRGHVRRRAQAALRMAEIAWTEDDYDYVEAVASRGASQALEEPPAEQRDAVRARIVEEREYDEIARRSGVSEQVIRKRVSRGLAVLRRRLSKEAP